MHSLLQLTHSVFRYFLLIFLIVLIVRSLIGWLNKTPYSSLDEKFSLWLFIVTHTQLLVGLTLYFVSPVVVFSSSSMKDATARYWLVEHISMMVIAIVLITMARITAKKLTDSTAKYRRLFIFNSIALLLIVLAILQSGRGFFNLPSY
jgi:hypothetical protein